MSDPTDERWLPRRGTGTGAGTARSFRTAREEWDDEEDDDASEGSQSSYESSDSEEEGDVDMAGLLGRKRSWATDLDVVDAEVEGDGKDGTIAPPRNRRHAGECGTLLRLRLEPVIVRGGIDAFGPAVSLMDGFQAAVSATMKGCGHFG
jgi:hypothetical protein